MPPVVDLYTLIDMMPVPVIAMVNGFAVGGGNVLANMCDLSRWRASRRRFARWAPRWAPTTPASARGISRTRWAASGPRRSGTSTASTPRTRRRRWASSTRSAPHAELRARTEALCEELTKRGPQALAALKAAFHARHNGVTGLSRLAVDHLVANYYHTEEAKEMGRAFNSKQDPDPDKFYR